ncbi:MAG: carboxypeptidase-like regulatory domain-containing protein [Candidatus Woesearchaeota archaeon]|nr:carboxypeptidase-like regulatory domain-containing protein [Candidatus Woesearchaeota archaeon]
MLISSVSADNCPAPAGSCTRGIFDISDNDFTICHGESCECTDLDEDGVCDVSDNCNPLVNCPSNYADCYNPVDPVTHIQADTGGTPGIGDACDCVTPVDGLTITKNTILCSGAYALSDAGNDGIIKFGANNVMLDCNGADIKGDNTGIGISTESSNGVKVINCSVSDYEYGIKADSSSNNFTRNALNNTNDIYLGSSSSSNFASLNHMYQGGKGNFYNESIGFSRIGNITDHRDCGLVNITQPAPGALLRPGLPIMISWTPQSSKYTVPVKYWIGYSADNVQWTTLSQGTASTSYTWETSSMMTFGDYTIKVIPNDGIANGTINATKITISEYGKVSGYVKCNEVAVPGATVQVKGFAQSKATADNTGHYEMTNAPIGRYDMTASYEGSKTQEDEYFIDLAEPSPQTKDFDDVCPISLDCTADCTFKGGDICMADCNGYTEKDSDGNIIAQCNLNTLCINVKQGLLIDNPDSPLSKLRCCGGDIVPVNEEQTNIKLGEGIKADDVIRTTRIVYYEGKPVKMIIIAWE